jgi:hypothetical protein
LVLIGSMMISMSMDVVPVQSGVARLGAWGRLELVGPATAVLKPTMAEEVELPEQVASDLPAAVLLLNESLGRLLILPYAGSLVLACDLRTGVPAYPPIVLHRVSDHGLRMASVRQVHDTGVLHLTESSIAFFNEEGTLAWRDDGNFAGWAIEGTTSDEVLLLKGDWAGNEDRERRALDDGRRLGLR